MSTTPETPATKEDTTVALLAYITPLAFMVGIVIPIIMHNNKKTALGAFHLRQSLGLILTSLVIWIPFMVIAFIPLLNLLLVVLWPLFGIAMFVFWIMGLLAAINGQQKPLPLVGEYYQKLLANAFV